MRSVELYMERPYLTGDRIYTLRIKSDDFENAYLKLSPLDRRIIDEKPQNTSDALLALEVIVRAIEGSCLDATD